MNTFYSKKLSIVWAALANLIFSSYTLESERGIQPEAQYCFDLEVPESFQPVVVDGEVHEFNLYTIDEASPISIQFSPKSFQWVIQAAVFAYVP